jgi:transposase
MEHAYHVAGIDVHKKMVAVAVTNARDPALRFECRRFGTTVAELRRLAGWLREQAVQEVAMESTAQYWKPVWVALEGQYRLHLAQARSNRGPRGRKTDFRDAQRVVNRLLSGDLVLSFVPDAEQRSWRMLTRTKYQLTRDRVRLQSQLESLLEECQIKLSSLVSDLLGASGRRILRALADGETDTTRLAALADKRLRASPADLADALSGHLSPQHRQVLALYLARLELLETQVRHLECLIAEAMAGYQAAVTRLAELPGLGVDSAQQIVAEVGPEAAAFPSAAHLASWVGVCPGRHESAGESSSDRSAKGNRTMRRLLNQLAHAAVRKEGTQLQLVFRRLSARMGYNKAIWAIAHRLCRLIWKVLHDGIRYVEQGLAPTPLMTQRRRQRLVTQLRRLGYQVTLTPGSPARGNIVFRGCGRGVAGHSRLPPIPISALAWLRCPVTVSEGDLTRPP